MIALSGESQPTTPGGPRQRPAEAGSTRVHSAPGSAALRVDGLCLGLGIWWAILTGASDLRPGAEFSVATETCTGLGSGLVASVERLRASRGPVSSTAVAADPRLPGLELDCYRRGAGCSREREPAREFFCAGP